jgi:hypothetical protein
MRAMRSRLIFLGAAGTSQVPWIRSVVRDLHHGGVVLLFPAGRLEPDPATVGPAHALLPWSASVDLIHRLAPEAKIVPVAVTGVLSPHANAHPLTRIRRTARDRQRVAVLLQMTTLRYRKVRARVAFGTPVADLDGDVTAIVVARVRELISELPSICSPLARGDSEPATTTAA